MANMQRPLQNGQFRSNIKVEKKMRSMALDVQLDPNTYSLAPFHSSLRNIVVRFCVKYLRLNLVIFSVVSISHFRLEQIWKFRFV